MQQLYINLKSLQLKWVFQEETDVWTIGKVTDYSSLPQAQPPFPSCLPAAPESGLFHSLCKILSESPFLIQSRQLHGHMWHIWSLIQPWSSPLRSCNLFLNLCPGDILNYYWAEQGVCQWGILSATRKEKPIHQQELTLQTWLACFKAEGGQQEVYRFLLKAGWWEDNGSECRFLPYSQFQKWYPLFLFSLSRRLSLSRLCCAKVRFTP